MSGTRLGAHTVVRLIGKGGIGSVYLARNEDDGSPEALKILLPELTGSPEMRERFEREISNSRYLKHPNIVKLLDYGKADGIWYYTMEYCKGGSLNDLLMRDGMPSPEKACGIIMQVLDGLQYAHNVEIPDIKLNDGSTGKSCGLIHRDIKPENILVLNAESENRRNGEPAIDESGNTSDDKVRMTEGGRQATDDRRQKKDESAKRRTGETETLNHQPGDPASLGNFAEAGRRPTTKDLIVKISDFGLAKSYRFAGKCGNTQTGSVGGSLAFISRQQLLNYKYSQPEVDVWSTAAVLYFLLTARPPRNCEGEKNPFNAILKINPAPIRNHAPEVPEELAAIIDRALDDSGSLFYKKASDLKRDIENYLS